jgi:DNA-binding transcriptional ArsR family regulator
VLAGERSDVSDITFAEPVPPAVLQEAAAVFAMLSAPIRLHILLLLSRGSRDVGTLASETGETVASVSHHLGKLKLARLVEAQRDGRRRVYVATDSEVTAMVRAAVASRQHPASAHASGGRRH